MSYLFAHSQKVATLALGHLTLVGLALVAALIVAIPLALLAVRTPRLSTPLLALLGAIYTIPSLALLAVLVQAFGLGSVPVFIALVAYAQFMLVRTFVASLRELDPAILDAADGLGFSARERLLRVEVPLALPVALGGVRVASVAMIAIATLGGYVGAGGLGSLIFDGLTLHHNDMVAAGALTACALAIATDVALRALERVV